MPRPGVFLAAVTAFLAGGCALPLPVAIASYVADGVLLAATGKTAGDAAISVARGQDCAVWRVLRDRPICRDYAPGEAPTAIVRIPDAAEGGEGGVPMPANIVVSRSAPPAPAALASAGRQSPTSSSDSETVRLVQRYLAVEAYVAGPVDGVAGPRADGVLLRYLTAPHAVPDLALVRLPADAGQRVDLVAIYPGRR